MSFGKYNFMSRIDGDLKKVSAGPEIFFFLAS
jgi:hypothetical protein